jgi:CBS domain-containing protein
MENLHTFLARYPPFDGIEPPTLEALVADAEQRSFQSGDDVLVEDGPPSPGLWVVLTGSMGLRHEGEEIQALEPGECFGHPSLLTAMSPAYTVCAREPSTCALIGGAAGRRLLSTEAGAAYVARTMRKRLVRTGYTVHGLHEVGTTPISAIMRPPTFVERDLAVREAAQRLSEQGISELLVTLDDERLGIVTDSDIRAHIASDGISADARVAGIARSPVVTVPVSHLTVDATVDMLAAETEHLAVLDAGRICGVLSAADLLGLDARSPIALRHMILGAPDEDRLVEVVARLPKFFLLLIKAGVHPDDLGRVLTLQHDAVTARLIDFAIWQSGEAPLSWTWLTLGSAARREFTLASDQDNALAYANPASGQETQVDAYFEGIGSEVNRGLARCGIGIDNNGVLAGKRRWRMSRSAWLATFDECLHQPDESHLVRATVAFDFRPTSGGLEVAPELSERIRAARRYPAFMRLMARTASGFAVPLTIRGQLATGKDGAPEGKLDIKRGGVIPLVNLVRFHALANGVTISATLERIDAVATVGGLERDAADALREAYGVISRVRFEHHAELIAAGRPPDNLIDLGELGPIANSELREAFHVVRRAQKRVAGWVPPGS